MKLSGKKNDDNSGSLRGSLIVSKGNKTSGFSARGQGSIKEKRVEEEEKDVL